MTMRRRVPLILPVACAAAITASLAQAQQLAPPAPSQPPCSTLTVAGMWAASSTGTIFVSVPGSQTPMTVPGAALGLVTIGYDGRFAATLTSPGNNVAEQTMKGTLTVNSDCSGEMNAVSTLGFRWIEQFVILDAGNEIWTISTGGMGPNPVAWQCRWRRISAAPMDTSQALNCSAGMITGTWVGTYNGVTLMSGKPAPVPTAITLIGAISYQGNLAGKYTNSVGGAIGSGQYTGSLVEVKPDCTGTWKWSLQGTGGTGISGQGIEKFVILDGGNEMWTAGLQGPIGPPVGIGRYRRISPVPLY
jgi:hypothetical protein